MARILDLNAAGDARDAIEFTVGQLTLGNLAVVPEESGWAVVGLAAHPSAAPKLGAISREHPEWLEAVAVDNPVVLDDYIAHSGKLGRRLTYRCWPGPVVISLATDSSGLDRAWPEESRKWGVRQGSRRWIVPADETFRAVLRAAPAPLLVLFPRPSQQRVPQSVVERAGAVLLAGAPRYDQPPTVVSLHNESCRVDEPGVVQERTLKRLGGEVILFVCTGNTCRSPMAEALFRKMLAERLQCQEDELIDRGFVVLSAGIAAHRGSAASPEAVQLLREIDGIDLRFHESQPLTEELLQRADRILTMTANHMQTIVSAYPEAAGRVRTLAPSGTDVSDPIGGGMDEYRRCRAQLVQYLEQLAADVTA